MLIWLKNLLCRNGNGNEKGKGKIEKANLNCESCRMVIDLKRINDDLADAVQATEERVLSCEVEANDGCL
jgi:hypothetical protein